MWFWGVGSEARQAQEEWEWAADKSSEYYMYLMNSGKPYPESEQHHQRTTQCDSVPCHSAGPFAPFSVSGSGPAMRSKGRSQIRVKRVGL